MGITIPESEMQFGEYKENQVFHIEESEQYTKNLRQQGVRCCEFILLRTNKLYFVEAKQSYPNPTNVCSSEERKKQYHEDIQEIVEKMRHSLELYASILLNKHSQVGISDAMKNMKELELKLVLVIKNADISWIAPLQDVLRKELRAELRIWKIPDFIILNEEMARKKHFIV